MIAQQSNNGHAPRWRRLPEERPRQIIEAALQVFGEHGLAGARLDDIARRAGVAKGTIYLYFPNKEALFSAVVHETVIENIDRLQRDLRTDVPPPDQLRQYAREMWSYLRLPVFETLYRLIVGELHSFPDLLQFYAQEVVARAIRLTSSVIERGIESGHFRPVNAAVAARILHALLIKHAVWCGQRERRECSPPSFLLADLSDEQVFEQVLDFYLAGLIAHPGAPNVPRTA